jgi:dipeptidyl-peptidase-3
MNDTRRYLLESVDEAAVVQLYADGFSALDLRDKILVWHLYLAAIAGRDIYYDQRYAHNLEMRTLLEAILMRGASVDPRVLGEIRRYMKLFWINTGPYNNLTARKFVLHLTRDELLDAVTAARRAGAEIAPRPGESLAGLVDRMAPLYFDVAFDPILTNKTPGEGRDAFAGDVRGALCPELASCCPERPSRRGGLSGWRPLRSRDSPHHRTSRRCRALRPAGDGGGLDGVDSLLRNG